MVKIVGKTELRDKICSKVKKKKAFCHGVFELAHTGYITHLEQAKEITDVLVVTITAAEHDYYVKDMEYADEEDEAMRVFCGEIEINSCHIFTLSVKDTTGAGDAFQSVAGIYLSAGASEGIELFMGIIVGILDANIAGNRELIEKVNVLKCEGILMNI